MSNPLFRKDPCLKYAIDLGFSITPGRKHWHARHPSGGHTIVPFGRKRSPRSERNILASIRRAVAKPVLPSTHATTQASELDTSHQFHSHQAQAEWPQARPVR